MVKLAQPEAAINTDTQLRQQFRIAYVSLIYYRFWTIVQPQPENSWVWRYNLPKTIDFTYSTEGVWGVCIRGDGILSGFRIYCELGFYCDTAGTSFYMKVLSWSYITLRLLLWWWWWSLSVDDFRSMSGSCGQWDECCSRWTLCRTRHKPSNAHWPSTNRWNFIWPFVLRGALAARRTLFSRIWVILSR